MKAMIFDMDGVLFDSHSIHRRAWRELLQSLGQRVSDEDLDFILDGPTRTEILQHFLGTLSTRQIARYAKKKDLLFRKEEANLRTIPGVRSFLRAAEAAGISKAIATCASRVRAVRMLKRHGFINRFAAVVTGDDVSNGKSDPEIFLRGAQKLKAAPRDIVLFEDAAPAIGVAMRIGMKCVGVTTGKRRSELLAAGAEIVIPDFTEVQVRHIQNLFI